jgi:hypothetical protein
MWEKIAKKTTDFNTFRLKVPWGWIVRVGHAGGEALVFVSDYGHDWKIEQVEEVKKVPSKIQ